MNLLHVSAIVVLLLAIASAASAQLSEYIVCVIWLYNFAVQCKTLRMWMERAYLKSSNMFYNCFCYLFSYTLGLINCQTLGFGAPCSPKYLCYPVLCGNCLPSCEPERQSLCLVFSFSLTWDPMGVKISKRYFFYQLQPKRFKTCSEFSFEWSPQH